MKNKAIATDVIIYQTKSGALEFKFDEKGETFWATQAQMAAVFGVNSQAVTKHIKNIYKEGELSKKATCSKMEQVQIEGKRKVKRAVDIYNLDAIISVGYRISSTSGTMFRQWATKTLRAHIVDGYTINQKRIGKNYQAFLAAVEKVQKLLPSGSEIDATSTLELTKIFAATWFSLDAFDKAKLPTKGTSRKQVEFATTELVRALFKLRNELIIKR
jgi:hypothetical protein